MLRGDWSLEFNRVPHMKSNGPQYQADCDDCVSCEATCEETCGCANGCIAEGCVGGSACRMHGGGYASNSSGGPGFGGGASYPADRGVHAGGMHGGFRGEEGGHMPPPPDPTPAANTRFHPVPTRPVFEPQVVAEFRLRAANGFPRRALSRKRTDSLRRPRPSVVTASERMPAFRSGRCQPRQSVRSLL